MSAARVLHVDLSALEHGPSQRSRAFQTSGPWQALATWGGTALGLACLEAHARSSSGDEPALVLAVGAAVRAGLPTAARAAVLARAPLSGRFAEGHVGGALGLRLAAVADALLVTGRCAARGRVLVLAADGSARLLVLAGLAGSTPAAAARALERELGPGAALVIGPAGERGLPFASLASGHSPPSFVGRGGLGAVLGALGLKALYVCAGPAPTLVPRAEAAALVARLSASPRLAARAAGGTMELFATPGGGGASLAADARARADERHGCRGCPTPCGWVFERSDGARQGARYGATRALGVDLGLTELDDALVLLARCDELGLDAKEAGAVLALLDAPAARARVPGLPAASRRAELARRLERLVEDPAMPGRAGAAALARELGLPLAAVRGQAVRPTAERAALLAQCVASGGTDPMRSFPFLMASAGHARLAQLLAPLPIPRAALDPEQGTAKGRLVLWHEDLIAAVDLCGFCAFSAAGLLADGLTDLDELAQWILPEALRAPADSSWAALAPGARLLAAGANLVLARRALNVRFGAHGADDEPDFARAVLAEPGMLDEYRALRGLDGEGAPSDEALAAFGTPAVLGLGRAGLAPLPRPSRPSSAGPSTRGRVRLRAAGSLAEVLGAEREVELPLPASVARVLAAAAESPAARAALFREATPLPSVWRDGRRLDPEDPVAAGDVLELVLVLAGG